MKKLFFYGVKCELTIVVTVRRGFVVYSCVLCFLLKSYSFYKSIKKIKNYKKLSKRKKVQVMCVFNELT